MRHYFVLFSTVTAIILSGCANHMDYRQSSEFTTPSAKGVVIAVAALDARPYVLDGSKQTNFVGLIRSLYGIPYAVTTTSGEPLSDEMGALVASALRKNGATVTQIKIPVGTSIDNRLALLKATNSPRVNVFEMREWKTDTYAKATLSYDITLSVLDNQGRTLASKSAKGEDKLSKDRPDRLNLSVAISSIFGGLLNEPEIVAAGVLEASSAK